MNPATAASPFLVSRAYQPGAPSCPAVVEYIQTLVAAHFGYTREKLLCPQRDDPLVLARHVAMLLVIEFTHARESHAARWFFRHHSGLHHALASVRDRIDTEPTVCAHVTVLRDKLRLATETAKPFHPEQAQRVEGQAAA